MKSFTLWSTFWLFVFCFALDAVGAEKTYKLRLKWFHQFQFAGYYAAQELGYYQEAGLNVEILEVDTKKSPVEEVLAGDVHFAVSDSVIVQHKLRGEPVTILAAVFQSSPLVLISLAKDNLVSPLDFRNKRVMYRRDVDDSLIMAMFNEVGLGEADFSYVPHNFDDDSLINGQTDVMSAYVSNQPFYYQQKGIPINITAPANYGIDFYGDLLITSERFLLEDTQDVLAFRRASLKGWEFALENPQQVIDWIYQNWSQKKSLSALAYEASMTRRLIKPKLVEIGSISKGRLQRLADIYSEKNASSSDHTLDGLDYQDYLKPDSNTAFWLKVTIGILLFSILLLLVVGWFNKQLKVSVNARTLDLYEAKKELESTNERLRRMVGYVAHDLRNPLGVIQSLASLVRYNQVKADQVMPTVGQSASKALELINSILETAALGLGKLELKMKSFDLLELTLQSVNSYQVFAQEKNVQIIVNQQVAVFVVGDPERLSQVTDNLILNAVKYSIANSVINVEIIVEKDSVTWKCRNQTHEIKNKSSIDDFFASFGFGMEIVHEILALHKTDADFTVQDDEFIVQFQLKRSKH